MAVEQTTEELLQSVQGQVKDLAEQLNAVSEKVTTLSGNPDVLNLEPTHYVIISVALSVVFMSVVGIVMWILNKEEGTSFREVVLDFTRNDLFLKLIAIVLIILATSLLALAGRLESEVAAILSGIAGFVLGSADFKRRQLRDNTDEG